MKRYTCIAAALLFTLCFAAGCGKKEHTSPNDVKVSVESVNKMSTEELEGLYGGVWQTSVVFINNQDGIKFDIDKYEFLDDGTGTYTPQKGKAEKLTWSVDPEGDLNVVYKDRDDKKTRFEYISGNLVSLETDTGETVETHLVKTDSIKDEEGKR